MAIGNIIMVVAVLLSHILKKPVAIIKPKNDAVAIGAGNVDYAQGNTFVQVPFFDGNANKEATHEKKDDTESEYDFVTSFNELILAGEITQ